MFRKLFVFGLVVAAGAVVWNEYRLWSHRSPRPPLQAMPAQLAASAEPLNGGEEQSEVTVIDLTPLQRQTGEPPTADTEEPATLPIRPIHGGVVRIDLNPVIPAQFRPHSADGDDCRAARGKLADACQKLVAFFWGLPAADSNEECAANGLVPEQLLVMPRPCDEPSRHCPQQSACPYLNGSAGGHYRHHGVTPAVRLHGEEQQSTPPAAPKPTAKRKQPKLDTMEIRPGDLPVGWLWRPF